GGRSGTEAHLYQADKGGGPAAAGGAPPIAEGRSATGGGRPGEKREIRTPARVGGVAAAGAGTYASERNSPACTRRSRSGRALSGPTVSGPTLSGRCTASAEADGRAAWAVFRASARGPARDRSGQGAAAAVPPHADRLS